MTRFHGWSRRRLVASSLIALGVVALAGTALAGHVGSDVTSYTGCLVPRDGVIIKVKAGDTPASPCTGGQTQVHLSGGDITKITVTGGLTGGGDNGEITIGLDPKYGLPQGCATGQVAKWNSSTSSWVCAADDNTTYSAGTGLDLSAGNEFSIEPAYRVKNTADCSSGQFATGFDDAGAIQCGTPTASDPSAWVKRVARAEAPQLPTTGDMPVVIELSLPAGSYAVHFTAMAVDDFHGDGETHVFCFVDPATTGVPASIGASNSTGGGQSIAFSEVATFASPGKVSVSCKSHQGSDHLEDLRLVAIRVGSVTQQ